MRTQNIEEYVKHCFPNANNNNNNKVQTENTNEIYRHCV